MYLLSPVNAFLRQSISFHISISSASLIGVGWQDSFSPHNSPGVPSMFGTSPFVLYSVLKIALSNTLAFSKIIEGSVPFLRVPL